MEPTYVVYSTNGQAWLDVAGRWTANPHDAARFDAPSARSHCARLGSSADIQPAQSFAAWCDRYATRKAGA